MVKLGVNSIQIFDGNYWQSICHYKNCIKGTKKKGLCRHHFAFLERQKEINQNKFFQEMEKELEKMKNNINEKTYIKYKNLKNEIINNWYDILITPNKIENKIINNIPHIKCTKCFKFLEENNFHNHPFIQIPHFSMYEY